MGVILAILGFLGLTALSLIGRWLSVEIGIQHLPFCRWLIKFAAARLPVDERAGAESEWLAVIADLRSPTAQLLHSLSFAFSAYRIRQAIEPRVRIAWPYRAYGASLLLSAGLGIGGAST